MTQDLTPAAAAVEDDGVADERHGVELLDGLEDLPVAEHVARFEAVHEELSARLSGGAA